MSANASQELASLGWTLTSCSSLACSCVSSDPLESADAAVDAPWLGAWVRAVHVLAFAPAELSSKRTWLATSARLGMLELAVPVTDPLRATPLAFAGLAAPARARARLASAVRPRNSYDLASSSHSSALPPSRSSRA